MTPCCGATRFYRPRQPQKTQLYRAVAENLHLFYATYDERFLTQHGPLTVRARRTLEGYLRCGRHEFGFGRAKCDRCGRELLVAYSCQLRGVCSSCQQKRAEIQVASSKTTSSSRWTTGSSSSFSPSVSGGSFCTTARCSVDSVGPPWMPRRPSIGPGSPARTFVLAWSWYRSFRRRGESASAFAQPRYRRGL